MRFLILIKNTIHWRMIATHSLYDNYSTFVKIVQYLKKNKFWQKGPYFELKLCPWELQVTRFSYVLKYHMLTIRTIWQLRQKSPETEYGCNSWIVKEPHVQEYEYGKFLFENEVSHDKRGLYLLNVEGFCKMWICLPKLDNKYFLMGSYPRI